MKRLIGLTIAGLAVAVIAASVPQLWQKCCPTRSNSRGAAKYPEPQQSDRQRFGQLRPRRKETNLDGQLFRP